MSMNFSCDNNGNRLPAHADMADPILASGQTLTNASADTNTTATVVAGGVYAITALNTGGFLFGLATTATAANIIWVGTLYRTIIVRIPLGYTTLHYQTDTNNGMAYLRRIG
jgi:hypothetical protein